MWIYSRLHRAKNTPNNEEPLFDENSEIDINKEETKMEDNNLKNELEAKEANTMVEQKDSIGAKIIGGVKTFVKVTWKFAVGGVLGWVAKAAYDKFAGSEDDEDSNAESAA